MLKSSSPDHFSSPTEKHSTVFALARAQTWCQGPKMVTMVIVISELPITNIYVHGSWINIVGFYYFQYPHTVHTVCPSEFPMRFRWSWNGLPLCPTAGCMFPIRCVKRWWHDPGVAFFFSSSFRLASRRRCSTCATFTEDARSPRWPEPKLPQRLVT